MSVAIEDMFKDMVDAGPQGQTGNGIKVEGDFLVEVVTTKGSDGHWGKRLVVSFRVLESSSPEVQVGATRSWSAKWGDKLALSDIKAFALACADEALEGLSSRDKDATATFMAYAAVGSLVAGEASNVARKRLGEDGKPFEGDPFEGLRAKLSTKPTTTKAGNTFVKHRWAPA